MSINASDIFFFKSHQTLLYGRSCWNIIAVSKHKNDRSVVEANETSVMVLARPLCRSFYSKYTYYTIFPRVVCPVAMVASLSTCHIHSTSIQSPNASRLVDTQGTGNYIAEPSCSSRELLDDEGGQ